MKPTLLIALLLPVFAFLTGCASTIEPLRAPREVEYWVTPPAEGAATAPATAPATQVATTDPAATRPGMIHKTRMVDSNETVRYLYHGNYDHIWQQSMELLTHTGFRLDRQDYRLGTMTTLPLHQPEFFEAWRRDSTGLKHALEASVNDQRHSVRITITPVEDKPEFYAIAIQVLVERQVNPNEVIGGLLFTTGSAFGATPVILRSDYAESQTIHRGGATTKPAATQPSTTEPTRSAADPWAKIGHDVALEKKLLDQLFEKI